MQEDEAKGNLFTLINRSSIIEVVTVSIVKRKNG
jgi:hypothetical protein